MLWKVFKELQYTAIVITKEIVLAEARTSLHINPHAGNAGGNTGQKQLGRVNYTYMTQYPLDRCHLDTLKLPGRNVRKVFKSMIWNIGSMLLPT